MHCSFVGCTASLDDFCSPFEEDPSDSFGDFVCATDTGATRSAAISADGNQATSDFFMAGPEKIAFREGFGQVLSLLSLASARSSIVGAFQPAAMRETRTLQSLLNGCEVDCFAVREGRVTGMRLHPTALGT
ncbi:MAG: hypothetical protein QM784_24170 [Polyangiaceae bacterium]